MPTRSLREPPNRRGSAGIEPLARGHVPHKRRHRLSVGAENRIPVVVERRRRAWQTPSRARPCAPAAKTTFAHLRHAPVDEALHERLCEPHFGAEAPERQVAVDRERTFRSWDRAHRLAGRARACPPRIDSRTCGNRRSMRSLSLSLNRCSKRYVLSIENRPLALTPEENRCTSSARPICRSKLKLDRYPRSETPTTTRSEVAPRDTGFAVAGLDAVLAQPVVRRRARTSSRRGRDLRGVLGAEAHPREQVDGAILAPQVAPADLEEPPRREVQALDALPAVGPLAHETPAALDAAAVAERRGRRLFDRHEHVVRRSSDPRGSSVTDTRRNSPSAISRRWLSTRLLSPSGWPGVTNSSRSIVSHARPGVADDEHVIDEDLRPLADEEPDVGPRTILAERDGGLNGRGLVAAVQQLEQDRLAILRHVRRVVQAVPSPPTRRRSAPRPARARAPRTTTVPMSVLGPFDDVQADGRSAPDRRDGLDWGSNDRRDLSRRAKPRRLYRSVSAATSASSVRPDEQGRPAAAQAGARVPPRGTCSLPATSTARQLVLRPPRDGEDDPQAAVRRLAGVRRLRRRGTPAPRKWSSTFRCASSSRSSSTEPSRWIGTSSACRDGGSGSPRNSRVTSGPAVDRHRDARRSRRLRRRRTAALTLASKYPCARSDSASSDALRRTVVGSSGRPGRSPSRSSTLRGIGSCLAVHRSRWTRGPGACRHRRRRAWRDPAGRRARRAASRATLRYPRSRQSASSASRDVAGAAAAAATPSSARTTAARSSRRRQAQVAAEDERRSPSRAEVAANVSVEPPAGLVRAGPPRPSNRPRAIRWTMLSRTAHRRGAAHPPRISTSRTQPGIGRSAARRRASRTAATVRDGRLPVLDRRATRPAAGPGASGTATAAPQRDAGAGEAHHNGRASRGRPGRRCCPRSARESTTAGRSGRTRAG